jgi:hypothetical protein
MKLRNAISFEDVFPWKEAWKKSYIKITIEASSSNCHKSKDDEVKLRKIKRAKITKTFGLDFLTSLLENESRIHSEAMSCPEGDNQYWNWIHYE